jgi:penicillin-binding protein A
MLLVFRRALATVVAALLVANGLFTTNESTDSVWLLSLGGAGVALLVAWWPRGTRTLPIFNRTMLRWGTIVLVCFFLMTIQLVKLQVVESSQTFNRIVVTESGDVFQNPRVSMGTAQHRRGAIVDRHGEVLAESVLRDDGTYERSYPSQAAAQLIGYYSPPLYGASQLEASFNSYLSGSEGGNPVVEWFDKLLHRERRGFDLHLSLDSELQQLAVDLLGSRAGAVVLLDAGSGEVLAMAGYPTYDPSQLYANAGQQTSEELAAINAYWSSLVTDPAAPLVFRPTQGLYTPGSTFKTLTASAALSEGISEPGKIYRNEGALNVDGRVIIEQNRPDDSRVDWTLEESYSYSLNVVFAQIGIELGADRIWEWADRFGINDEIPFDILTSGGQVSSSRAALVDSLALVADTAFGQGEILTTPLAMAMIVSAVANEGTMIEPYLVSSVRDENDRTMERFSATRWREVLDSQVAAEMRSLMIASVDYGYATGAAIEGVTVGGKTGTAETGDGAPHAWFTGFAERDDRTLVVSVIVENGGSGSQVALPIGRELLRAAIDPGIDRE